MLDRSLTADLVRNIDRRTQEADLVNYTIAMGTAALIELVSIIDTIMHGLYFAPKELFCGNFDKTKWHLTRAVSHLSQSIVNVPGIIVPRFSVFTAEQLQLTTKWEKQIPPNGIIGGLRNTPHAMLALKVAAGIAGLCLAAFVGHQVHKFTSTSSLVSGPGAASGQTTTSILDNSLVSSMIFLGSWTFAITATLNNIRVISSIFLLIGNFKNPYVKEIYFKENRKHALVTAIGSLFLYQMNWLSGYKTGSAVFHALISQSMPKSVLKY